MIFHFCKQWVEKQDKAWLLSYVATLLFPWALIFTRGTADTCCVIPGALFLWHSYKNKQWQWIRDPLVVIGFVAWVWLLLVVTPLATNELESLMTALPWMRFVLFYAALRYWVLTQRKYIIFLGYMLATMLGLVMIDTLWQYVFGVSLSGHPIEKMEDKKFLAGEVLMGTEKTTGRLTGPLDNVKVGIFMAKMLLPALSICSFSAFLNRSQCGVVSCVFLFFAAVTIILLTGERTAFASLIIAFFLSGVVLASIDPKLSKWLLSGIFIIVLVADVLLFSQPWVQERAIDFHLALLDYGNTPYGQLVKAGIMVGQEYWQHGAGLKGFREVCIDLVAAKELTYCNLHPHNLYIEWFAESGIAGLVMLICMAVYLFYICGKALWNIEGIFRIFIAIVLAGIVLNFFPFMATQSFFSNWPGLLLWYSVSVCIASLNMLERK